jgi:hypothetical protein
MRDRIAPLWQMHRRILNHDELKNRFLPALAKCINLLDGRVEDPEFERAFLTEILAGWLELQKLGEALCTAFETGMSPRSVVEQPPLRQLDQETKSWIAEIVHGLWLARCRVRELIGQATKCIGETGEAYAALQRALADGGDQSFETLRKVRPEFLRFYDLCRRTSEMFERFPSEVQVT